MVQSQISVPGMDKLRKIMRKTQDRSSYNFNIMKIYGYDRHINCHYLNMFVTVACGCSLILLIGMLAMSVCVCVCVLGGGGGGGVK